GSARSGATRTSARRSSGRSRISPRGFAPRSPPHAHSRAASPARSVRVARSLPLARGRATLTTNLMTWLLVSLIVAQAASLSGVTHTDPVPTEMAAPVAANVAPGGVRATANGTTITFWWVKDLPGASWTDVPEGTLVGAVKLDADVKDIRGHVMKAGVYTLRYG